MPGSVFALIPIIKPPNCTYLVHTSLWYRAGCINKLRFNSTIIKGINRGCPVSVGIILLLSILYTWVLVLYLMVKVLYNLIRDNYT